MYSMKPENGVRSNPVDSREGLEERLERRGQYLAALVAAQQRLLVRAEPDSIYHTIIQSIGPVSDASRVYVFERFDGPWEETQMLLRAEWCSEGIPSRSGSRRVEEPFPDPLSSREPSLESASLVSGGPERRECEAGDAGSGDTHVLEIPPAWEESLSQGAPVIALSLEAPEAVRGVLEAGAVLSLLALPVLLRGRLHGFVGFDHCTELRCWDVAEVNLLRGAATAVSMALERHEVDKALRESE